MDSTVEKQHAHDLIERLEPEETRVAVRFLEFMLLDPVTRSLATAPVEGRERLRPKPPPRWTAPALRWRVAKASRTKRSCGSSG